MLQLPMACFAVSMSIRYARKVDHRLSASVAQNFANCPGSNVEQASAGSRRQRIVLVPKKAAAVVAGLREP